MGSGLSFVVRRLAVVFLVLVFYRLGTYVPIPFADYQAVMGGAVGGTLISTVNLFSGGALSRMAVFSLNVMPYIIASVVFQLVMSGGDKGNSSSQSKSQIRYLTLLVALLQAVVVVFGFLKSGVVIYGAGYKVAMIAVSVCTLVGGAVLMMWVGEFISLLSVGNGISILIFTGIVAELPGSIVNTAGLWRRGVIPSYNVLFGLVLLCFLVFLVVFVEYSFRNVPVQYPKRQAGNKLFDSVSSYIPLKINMSGVIPPIFANATLMLPMTVFSFYGSNGGGGYELLLRVFAPGTALYSLVYGVLIVFFAFFYTFIVFNPKEVADGLKRGGGVILGRRPGPDTSLYLERIVLRLTCFGSLYICFICLLSEFLRTYLLTSLTLSGTSILIAVGVINDMSSQIRMHLFSQQYKGLARKSGLRRRGA